MALDYLHHLRAESDRFLAVVRDADPAAPVPSCPEWNADDLLWHLGEVQEFWGLVVEGRLQSHEDARKSARPDGRPALLSFFEEQTERLERVLREADPAEAVWMWASDKTVGYVRRRQAHEALIHRVDAELTAGVAVAPLDPDLATDGVLELLDVMYGGCPDWGSFATGDAHLEVRATDTGLAIPVVLGRFTGTDPDDGTTYDEEDLSVQAADPGAVPAVVVSGTAADLAAWMWHRRDDAGICVEGDPAVAARFLTLLEQPLN